MRRKKQIKKLWLPMLLAALLVLAGCGGGSDQGSDRTSAKSGTTAGGGATSEGSEGKSDGAEEPEAGGTTGAPKNSGSAPSRSKPPENKEAPEEQEAQEAPSSGGSGAKAQFVKQAEQICAQGRKRALKDLASYIKQHRGQNPNSEKGSAKALKAAFLPVAQEQVNELRALDAPSADKAQVQAILDSMQTAVDTAERSPAETSADITKPFAKSGRLARQYGINACAYG
jgi:hypothetical protein